MAQSANKIDVYLEIGKKRAFAGALDWPGWCRSGRDEESALRSLLEYGPRYARVLKNTRLAFQPPADVSVLTVKERLSGNATTDFGAPGIAPSSDARAVEAGELQRFEKILEACWRTLDHALEIATGRELRTGPRGGGRQVEAIVQHLLDSDAGYIGGVGWRLQPEKTAGLTEQLELARRAVLEALAASARGAIPARGPRGGLRWSPRYFVRRLAWHTLDHAWEIEDRVV